MAQQKILGYDPETGQPVIGYDPDTGRMVFQPSPETTPARPRDSAEAMTNRYGSMRQANVDQIPRTLAMAASAATLGAGAIPAMLATGGAGAAGSLIRSAIDDTPETMRQAVTTAGTRGVGEGLLEGAGRGAGKALSKLSNLTMRRALGPSKAAVMKYGDLPQQAIDKGVSVTGRGLNKITNLRELGQQAKIQAIEGARPASLLTEPIQHGAAMDTIDSAVGQNLAGMRPTMAPTPAITRFGGGRPGLSIKEAEIAKRELDRVTDAAQQAQRMGKTPALRDLERKAITKQIRTSQEALVPELGPINRDIRQSFGLENALRQRLAQPATGVADDLTALGGLVDPRIALGRILREPQVLSQFSLLLNQLSKGGKVAPNTVRALMATAHERQP